MEEELNKFCLNKTIISYKTEFFQNGHGAYWSIFLEYEKVLEESGNNLAVESISWYDVVEYCNRLSSKEMFTLAYTISEENVTWNLTANNLRFRVVRSAVQ